MVKKITKIFSVMLLAFLTGLTFSVAVNATEGAPSIYDDLNPDFIYQDDSASIRRATKENINRAIDKMIPGYSTANESKNMVIFKVDVNYKGSFSTITGEYYVVFNVGVKTPNGTGITAHSINSNQFQFYKKNTSTNSYEALINGAVGGSQFSTNTFLSDSNEAFVLANLKGKFKYDDGTYESKTAILDTNGLQLLGGRAGTGSGLGFNSLQDFLSYGEDLSAIDFWFEDRLDNLCLSAYSSSYKNDPYRYLNYINDFYIRDIKVYNKDNPEDVKKQSVSNINLVSGGVGKKHIYYADEDILYDDLKTLYFPGLENEGAELKLSNSNMFERKGKKYIVLDFTTRSKKNYTFESMSFTINGEYNYNLNRNSTQIVKIVEDVDLVQLTIDLGTLDGLDVGDVYFVNPKLIRVYESSGIELKSTWLAGGFTSTVVEEPGEGFLPGPGKSGDSDSILGRVKEWFGNQGADQSEVASVITWMVSVTFGLMFIMLVTSFIKRILRFIRRW